MCKSDDDANIDETTDDETEGSIEGIVVASVPDLVDSCLVDFAGVDQGGVQVEVVGHDDGTHQSDRCLHRPPRDPRNEHPFHYFHPVLRNLYHVYHEANGHHSYEEHEYVLDYVHVVDLDEED